MLKYFLVFWFCVFTYVVFMIWGLNVWLLAMLLLLVIYYSSFSLLFLYIGYEALLLPLYGYVLSFSVGLGFLWIFIVFWCFSLISTFLVLLLFLVKASYLLPILLVSFVFKSPFFPFTEWLLYLHVIGNVCLSVILAGIYLKVSILPFIYLYSCWPLVFSYLAFITVMWLAIGLVNYSFIKRLVAMASIFHVVFGFILFQLMSFTGLAIYFLFGFYVVLHQYSSLGCFYLLGFANSYKSLVACSLNYLVIYSTLVVVFIYMGFTFVYTFLIEYLVFWYMASWFVYWFFLLYFVGFAFVVQFLYLVLGNIAYNNITYQSYYIWYNLLAVLASLGLLLCV